MPETVTVDGPPVANEAATVSASALALHLDCSRTYIGKLEAEGVIQRQGGSFPLDQSRVAYLRHLRRERRQSPRSEADADHAMAKAALLRIRVEEKQRTLTVNVRPAQQRGCDDDDHPQCRDHRIGR